MCYAEVVNSASRVARKGHVCDWCGETIERKSTYRYWFGILEGSATQSRVHPECQKAIDYFVPDCWYGTRDNPRGGYPDGHRAQYPPEAKR